MSAKIWDNHPHSKVRVRNTDCGVARTNVQKKDCVVCAQQTSLRDQLDGRSLGVRNSRHNGAISETLDFIFLATEAFKYGTVKQINYNIRILEANRRLLT